ncbi:hypothetical protein PRUPE_1G571800 [Prunus persica]|uniref:Uncharacterized protein n=1 Tax=Prunus persica TaxID=3760 RepID=A0A251RJ94_PRUPE|nr:hypothetical protein PRUPE_1G571800 [Prunus persica]
MPQSWSATSVFIHGWCIRLWHRQGRVPKACVVSIVAGSFECTNFATWQFGFLSRFLSK